MAQSRFEASAFYSTFYAGGAFDIWDAKPRDVRFNVPAASTIVVDSSTEANLPYLAHTHLGDQNLWWVLLYYNGLTDPIGDVYASAVLRIPDRSSLITYLERTVPGKQKRKFVI